jgi:hypothetical protein
MTLTRRLLLTAAIWVGALFIAFFLLPSPQANAGPIQIDCAAFGTTNGTTFTLNADCNTTVTLTVDDGWTVDGGGHTITAHDDGVTPFPGPVLTNAVGATSMHVANLTIRGTGFSICASPDQLSGIRFHDASGTVSNVNVLDITLHSGCVQGHGIWVRAVAADEPVVTITNTTVTGFQRTGLLGGGATSTVPVILNVSGSTFGPADATIAPGVIAQNAVQIGSGPATGASSFTDNTVVGRAFGGTGTFSTAMLVTRASNLTIGDNTITGAGTDRGIFVGSASTNVTIENNTIERTSPASPENSGFGVSSDDPAQANLVCNTFSGWVTNLVNETQPPCITTTALPNGTVGTAYSAPVAGHSPTPPVTWSVTGGALPPGLTMAADGTISGTPTTEGAFTFTVTATDTVPSTATRDFIITIGPVPPVADLVGLVDPASGIWSLRGAAGGITTFYYGNPGDVPFVGDWDCDGDDTPGLYRQSDGFVYLRNSNTQGIADIRFFFGNPGDIPMAGDFNNDGCDTVGIYRPSNTTFYVINKLGANNGGLGPADFSFVFGNPGDKPFVGDFNGDGIDTIGLHRETTGLVYFRQTNTQGIADAQFFFGNPDDRFVAGDWGVVDGIQTPGVFRPSNTTFYLRHTNTQGVGEQSFVFGASTHLPIAGNWAP